MSGPAGCRSILLAFVRTMGAESHTLRTHPSLLWQQLHNGLAPLGLRELDAALAEEAGRRMSERWLRQRGGSGAAAMRVVASLESGVESCDVSDVAGAIAVGCRDGRVLVLDAGTGDATVLGRHDGPVSCCGFTSDGSYIVSGSNDSTLRVFETRTGRACGTFRGHRSPVTCLAVLPDSTHVVSGGQDRTLLVWDIATLDSLGTLPGHDRGVLCCSASANGKILASGDTAGRVIVWDLDALQLTRMIDAHDDAVLCCTLDSRGERLATGAADASARLWNIREEHPPVELDGHTDEVTGCAFARDGSLVTVSADRSIRSWDATTGTPFAASAGQGGPLTCVSVRDGEIAYTGATNGAVVAWAIADLGAASDTAGHSAAVTGVATGPGGAIATSSLDATVIVWHASDGRQRRRLVCAEPLVGCALRQQGSVLVTPGSHQPVAEWDLATGTQLPTLRTLGDIVLGCAADPADGPLVLGTMKGLTVYDADKRPWRLNVEVKQDDADDRRLREAERSDHLPAGLTRREIRKIRREGAIMARPRAAASQCVAVHPVGGLAAVGDAIGRVTLVDLHARTAIRTIEPPWSAADAPVGSLAFAPDGEHLAIGYAEGTIVVRAIDEGRETVSWKDGSRAVLACVFLADSNLVATGSEEGHLSVWEWRSQAELYRLPMANPVRACALVPGEPVLVCGDAAGDVRIVETVGLAGGPARSQRVKER